MSGGANRKGMMQTSKLKHCPYDKGSRGCIERMCRLFAKGSWDGDVYFGANLNHEVVKELHSDVESLVTSRLMGCGPTHGLPRSKV